MRTSAFRSQFALVILPESGVPFVTGVALAKSEKEVVHAIFDNARTLVEPVAE